MRLFLRRMMPVCAVFLQYPVLELVVAEEAQDAATDFMMGLLITYRGIFHDEDAAVNWIGGDAFQSAYHDLGAPTKALELSGLAFASSRHCPSAIAFPVLPRCISI